MCSTDQLSEHGSAVSGKSNRNSNQKPRRSKERKSGGSVNSSTFEKTKVTITKPTHAPPSIAHDSNPSMNQFYSHSTGLSPAKQPEDFVDELFSTQSTNPDDWKLISKKRCKVRVYLPLSEDLMTNEGTVEIKVNIGDNIGDIVDRLVQTYHLNYEIRNRVMNQLNVSCCR